MMIMMMSLMNQNSRSNNVRAIIIFDCNCCYDYSY